MKTQLFHVLFLFLAVVPSSAFGAGEKPVVEVGVIAPLTLGNAERGQDIVHSLTLAAEELSRQSGGVEYRFTVEDGKCGVGNSAVTAAEKLININKVKFLIIGCSGEALQAGPIAQRAGVLTVAVFSSHPDVKKLGDFIFRTCPDQERAVSIFGAELACRKTERMALLSEENVFTQGMKALVQKALKEKIIFNEDFPVETTDFRTLLTKAKNAKADALYFNAASPATLGALVRQAHDLGLALPMYAFMHPDDRSYFQASGPSGAGVRYLGLPSGAERDQAKNFLRTFESRFGAPHVEFLALATLDALTALDAAVRSAGPNSAAARDFLTHYHARGATGDIAFDENGDLIGLDFILKQVGDDGIGRPIPRCTP